MLNGKGKTCYMTERMTVVVLQGMNKWECMVSEISDYLLFSRLYNVYISGRVPKDFARP